MVERRNFCKQVIGIIVVIVIVAFAVGYVHYFLKNIDTKFAVNFSEAFRNYNIDDVDRYLSEYTLIVCNDKSGTYGDLRENVIEACGEKKYLFEKGSSYGYGNDTFTDGIQYVDIKVYGKLEEMNMGECHVYMKLKREGFFQFKIDTIECDESIFEELFF